MFLEIGEEKIRKIYFEVIVLYEYLNGCLFVVVLGVDGNWRKLKLKLIFGFVIGY